MTKLGRGLEALIDSGPESTDKTTGITTIKIDNIAPNRYQHRKRIDKTKLQELANSLKENGLIQPIIVTKRDETKYELVAGERRLEASRLAGFDEIPVIIRSVSPKEQLQFAIIENVQREDLSAIEEARAYQQLNEEFKLTHSQISEIVGKDRVTISNLIRLLKLNDNIQQMILDEKISSGHARAVLQVDEQLQEDFANLILKNNLSVRKTELEAKRIKETGSVHRQKPETIVIPKLNEYEKTLINSYKMRVTISGKEDKGRIIFHYASEKELTKLIKALKKNK